MSTYHDHKLRHKILEVLNEKTEGQRYKIDRKPLEWSMPVEDLITIAEISEKDYRRVNSLLYDEKEIVIENMPTEYVRIAQKGMTALNDKKYKKLATASINEPIYNVTKWLIPLVLAAVTLYTTIRTIKENQVIRERLNKIEAKVDTLK